MVSKRKHPKFRRPNYGRSSRSRIKIAWRRPRGIDNKKRLKIAYMGASPSIGYGQPSEIRHMHPQGMLEVLVHTPSELSGLAKVAIRVASGVGRKKREGIIKLAESMKLRVLNKMSSSAGHLSNEASFDKSKKYPVKAVKPKTDKEKKAEAKKADEKKPEEKKAETSTAAKIEAPKA